MNKKPITIVTDFEAEYMERIQNYTLKDLADKFGMQYSMNTVDCINLYISFIRQIIINPLTSERFKSTILLLPKSGSTNMVYMYL